MALELRNGIYYVRLMVNGRRIQQSTRTGDKAVAKQVHQKMLGELVLGMHGVTKPKAPTLREAYEDAIRTHYARTKSLTTVRINYTTLERILGGTTRVDEIDTKAMNKVVATMIEEGAAAGTINRKLSLLSKLIRLNLDSCPKVPLQKEYTGRTRYLSRTDEEVLWQALDARIGGNPTQPVWKALKALLVVLLDTGLRLGEALALEADHVDVDRGELHVWESKGNLSRTVPLTGRAKEAVIGLVAGGTKLTKDIAEHRFHQIREDAKMGSDVVIHSLRHTCATRLVQSGMNLKKVQQWMGHKDINTTLRYAHIDTADLHEGRDSLESGYQSSTKNVASCASVG